MKPKAARILPVDPQEVLEKEFNTLAMRMPGFKRRDGQALMVDHIRRHIMEADPTDPVKPISLLEGGTGTGKSIAYMLGVIPKALRSNQKVVLSTATIQLQEQIYRRDLPAFLKAMGLNAKVAHVKGWGRYVCEAKAESAIAAGLPEARTAAPMLAALQDKQWDGDLDAWKGDSARAHALAASSGSCTRRACPKAQTCGAFQSRNGVKEADIVVTNHALALTAMLQPGSKDLVGLDPAETIVVFDEAHQLESVARGAMASRLAVTHLPGDLRAIAQEIEKTVSSALPRAGKQIDGAVDALERAAGSADALTAQLAALPFVEDPSRGAVHRFKHGQLPLALADGMASLLEKPMAAVSEAVQAVCDAVAESTHAGTSLEVRVKEHLARVNGVAAMADMALAAARRGEVQALWATRSARGAIELDVAPAEVGELLASRVFARPAGTVLTSATMQVLGDFNHFRRRMGLLDHPLVATLGVSSPFDYRRQGLIVTPAMVNEPTGKDTSAYEEELAEKLPLHICKERGTLVLFTSKAMMDRTFAAMPAELKAQVLVQGAEPKQALLDKHRDRIAKGMASTLFGLGSMAEGLDLPGALCSHVIITRLSFEVPTDPVVATMTEVIEARGGSAFNELALPECATRLVQAAGRLVRTVDDWGLVTILDKRISTKRYGKALLATLPDFPRSTNAHVTMAIPAGQLAATQIRRDSTVPVSGVLPGQFNPMKAPISNQALLANAGIDSDEHPGEGAAQEDPMSTKDDTPIIPFKPPRTVGSRPASSAPADSTAAIEETDGKSQEPRHADATAIGQRSNADDREGWPAEYDDYADLAAASAAPERAQATPPQASRPAEDVGGPATAGPSDAANHAPRQETAASGAAGSGAGAPALRGSAPQDPAGAPAAEPAAIGKAGRSQAGDPAIGAGQPAVQGGRPAQEGPLKQGTPPSGAQHLRQELNALTNRHPAHAGQPATGQGDRPGAGTGGLPAETEPMTAATSAGTRGRQGRQPSPMDMQGSSDLVRAIRPQEKAEQLAAIQLRDRDIGSPAALINYPFQGPYSLEHLPPSRSGARETLAALSEIDGEVPQYFTRLANALVDEIDRANLVIEIYNRLPQVGESLRLGCVSRGDLQRDAEIEQVEPGCYLVTDNPGSPSEVVRLYRDPAHAAAQLAMAGAVPYEPSVPVEVAVPSQDTSSPGAEHEAARQSTP